MAAFEAERPAGFACVLVRAGDSLTARLQGELDLVSADEAETALTRAMTGVRRLVLDVRDITFIDSTGLRLLLRWDAAARADGFRVEVTPGSTAVERLLELTGLKDHFTSVKPGD